MTQFFSGRMIVLHLLNYIALTCPNRTLTVKKGVSCIYVLYVAMLPKRKHTAQCDQPLSGIAITTAHS